MFKTVNLLVRVLKNSFSLAKGVTTQYEYDVMDRLIRKITPAADGNRAVTRYVYDEAGNLEREIAPNQYDASKDTSDSVMSMPGMSYVYDEMNRRTTTVSPDGTSLEYVLYDTKGQVLKIVDGLRYMGDMIYPLLPEPYSNTMDLGK